MQDTEESNLQNTYFQNRSPSFLNGEDLSTFQYSTQLNPPNDNSHLSLLIKEIMRNHLKVQASGSNLIGFLQELPEVCSSAIKRLKRKNRDTKDQIGKPEQKSLVFSVFTLIFKQLLAFLSYIETKTTLEIRISQLYSRGVRFMIKWEEGSFIQSKLRQGSKQETNQGISDMTVCKKMIFVLERAQKSPQSMQKVSEKKSNISPHTNEQQGQLVQDLLRPFLQNQKTALSVLKAKKGAYYILYLTQLMGKGGFGQVCRGESLILSRNNDIQCQTWAVKWCKKNINQYKQCGYSISQEREHEILMQINRTLRLRPPHKGGKHIIELKEVIDQKDRKYIVYEYCQYNSLRDLISRRKHVFNKKNIFQIGLQMAEILKLIHFDLIQDEEDFLRFSLAFSDDSEVRQDNSAFLDIPNRESEPKGIIHRDIKLNNILVKEYSSQHIVIKLIDWAFSKRAYTNLKMNKISCGTTQYQAPQFQERKRYNSKVDIWAYGAVIFELLGGKPLADKTKGKDAKIKFREAIQGMTFVNVKDELSQQEIIFWKDLLLGTLNDKPDNRWSALEVHAHFETFNHYYKEFSINDLSALTSVKQVKSLLLYHINAVASQMKTKGRLVFKTFNHYSKLLIQAVEAIGQRRIQRRIGIKDEEIEISMKEYRFLQGEAVMKVNTAGLRLQEAAKFFQQTLAQYKKKKEIISCIEFTIEQLREAK